MVFGSSKKGVLYLTDDSLLVYKVSGKSVSLLELIDWNQEGMVPHLTLILKKNFSSVIVLNDTVDQHYRKERVPKVGFLDAGNVINRRLAMAFPEFPIRAFKKVGEAKQSKDDARSMGNYLFCACPDDSHIRAVVNAIRDSGVGFQGVSLLPMESEGLVTRLVESLSKKKKLFADKKSSKGEPKGWLIFVGQNASGGLRQIVVKDGGLALTRISPIVETDADVSLWCQEVKRELSSTMGYLSRFGYNSEDPLSLVVIGGQDSGPIFDEIMDIEADIHVIGASEAAKIVGMKATRAEAEHVANSLHVGWVAKKARLSFPLKSGMINAIAGARTQASMVAALLVLGLVGSMYFFASAVINLNQNIRNLEVIEKQQRQVQLVYDKEVERKEALGIDVKLIQNSFDVHSQLQSELIDPLEIYQSIGRAMQGKLKLDTVTIRKMDAPKDAYGNVIVPPEGETRVVPSETVLKFSFPGTVDIEKGNDAVIEFSSRLKKQFSQAEVRVTKILKDVSYKGEMQTKVGVVDEQAAPDDLEAEIIVTRGGAL
ncbi:MAG: hypothetical protein ACPG05_05795 [Bdellovibrionales bacterium]